MTDELLLSEIVTLSRVLRQDMWSSLDQLTKDRAYLSELERFGVAWREQLHFVNAGEMLQRQYREMLDRLLTLVYRYLPAEGRTLREISRQDSTALWNRDTATGELQGIEVAATVAVTPAVSDNARPEEYDNDLPSLDTVDVQILQLLSDGVARTQYDLVAINKDRKTLGKRLSYLRGIDYVKHPDGRSRGNVITPTGLRRLDMLRESSP